MAIVRAVIGGNGFGNEFLYLAKALTVAIDLKLNVWLPHWRGAYRQLPPSLNEKSLLVYRLHNLKYRLLGYKSLVFDKKLYDTTNETSISKAVTAYFQKEKLDLSSKLILSFPDLDVGIPSVAHRLEYLRSLLMCDRKIARAVYTNLDKMRGRPLKIGVHIRQGDFEDELPLGETWQENQWNTRIPLAWYTHIAALLQQKYGKECVFFLATNDLNEGVASFITQFEPITGTATETRSCYDLVDLLTLSYCDLLVTSYSWFSHWAAGFSNRPYVHYTPAPAPQIHLPKGQRDSCRMDILMPLALPDRLQEYCNSVVRCAKS